MNYLKTAITIAITTGLTSHSMLACALVSEQVYNFNVPSNYTLSASNLLDIEQSLGRLTLNYTANDIPGDTLPSKYPISADFNNDGNADIFSSLYAPRIYLGNGSGAFAEDSISQRAYNAVSADFNNDGNMDMYTVSIGGSQQNYLHMGNGNGTFVTSIISGDIGGASTSATAADFNNDNNIDLYITNLATNAGIVENRFFLGDGTGSFVDSNFFGNTWHSSDSAAADFNNDGNMDLYVVNFDLGGNKVYLGDGGGYFPASYDHGNPVQSFAVTAADFNNDGNMDVYIANVGFDELHLGDGSGNFTSASILLYTSGIFNNTVTRDVISKDFNNDGNMDLYLAMDNGVNNNNGQNRLYFGNGQGGFTVHDIAGDLGQSSGATSDDFNNDGLLDIYVSNDALVSNTSSPALYEQNKLYLGHYSDLAPSIESNVPFNFTTPLTGFTEVTGPNHEGETVYQFSLDGGNTWKFYNGTAWVNTSQANGNEANSAQQLTSVILGSLATSGSLKWRAYLLSNGAQRVEIDKIVVSRQRKYITPIKIPYNPPLDL